MNNEPKTVQRAEYRMLDGSIVTFNIQLVKREDKSFGAPIETEHDGKKLQLMGVAENRAYYRIVSTN